MVCLNLVKASEKRPRETLLRTEFQNSIQYLNQGVGLIRADTFTRVAPAKSCPLQACEPFHIAHTFTPAARRCLRPSRSATSHLTSATIRSSPRSTC